MNRLSRLGVAVATLALISSSGPQQAVAISNVFSAHLRGSDVVPATQSKATGEAKFNIDAEGTLLQYRINVSNIENVVKATIHVGMPSENTEAVAILYGPAPSSGGKKTGVLTTGTLTQASLVGSLAGHPLSDLISEMRAGRVYVVVATDNGTTDRQPGNLPDGEIRGQIR